VRPDGVTVLSARAKVVPSQDRRGEWYTRRLNSTGPLTDTLA